MEEENQTD